MEVKLVLLDPPGWHGLWSQGLPHWSYVQAVDQALTDRAIPPGIVRADVALRTYHQTDRQDTIYMTLIWDVSRTGARGGGRLTWDDDTGWSYAKLGPSTHDVLLEAPVTPLHRVFADPGDVAEVADGLVRHWRTSDGDYGTEWDEASGVRNAIEALRRARVTE
ncbi:DUF6292 family protein [Streptomyces coeruleorubidus]|uniref:DUF6292 family protein n=1 Tax=Streptomyces coeruleorubidus TaxID=116188 RepID=A0ABZ0KRQ3_STRC4|nr:DUF6292 family protein [Streptomyces coeruleorubidus]WOT40577.1 DUF6292 family protein [Streptomyces coeruleorubidus]